MFKFSLLNFFIIIKYIYIRILKFSLNANVSKCSNILKYFKKNLKLCYAAKIGHFFLKFLKFKFWVSHHFLFYLKLKNKDIWNFLQGNNKNILNCKCNFKDIWNFLQGNDQNILNYIQNILNCKCNFRYFDSAAKNDRFFPWNR